MDTPALRRIPTLIRTCPWIYLIPLAFYLVNFLHIRGRLLLAMSKIKEAVPSTLDLPQHLAALKHPATYLSLVWETLNNIDYGFTGVFVGSLLITLGFLIFISHPYLFKKIRPYLSTENQATLKTIERIFFILICIGLILLIIALINMFALKNSFVTTILLFLLNPLIGIVLSLIFSFIEAGYVWALSQAYTANTVSLSESITHCFRAFPSLYYFNLCIMFLGYIPQAMQFLITEGSTSFHVQPPSYLYPYFLGIIKIIGFGIPLIKVGFFFLPFILIIENKNIRQGIQTVGALWANHFFPCLGILFLSFLLCYIPMVGEWIGMGFLNKFTWGAQCLELCIGLIFLICAVFVTLITMRFFLRQMHTSTVAVKNE